MHAIPVRLSLVALIAASVGLATAAPAGADATFGCSASAARVTVLGVNTIEPTTANVGAPTCKTASSALSNALTGLNPAAAGITPVSAQAVAASTSYSDGNGDPTKQAVQAVGGIAGLKLSTVPGIPGLSIDQISSHVSSVLSGVTAINIPVPASVTTVLGLLNQPLTVTADATKAVQALVPTDRVLAATDLLDVKAATAVAGASCVNGAPQVTGGSQLAGVSVAGESLDQTLGAGQAVTRSVSLLPKVTVNFSTADPTKIDLSSNVAAVLNAVPNVGIGLLGPALTLAQNDLNAAITAAEGTGGVVTTALKALPAVTVPEIAANVSLLPNTETRDGDKLTEQALALSASVGVVDTVTGTLTQTVKLVDAVIGEAKASESGLDCSQAASILSPNNPTGATLQCSTRKLVLVDVLQDGNRVKLNGVADPKYIGKTVSIVFSATGQTVAHAVVRKDGSFRTTAPLPAAKVRDTNLARYTAKIGGERSLELKLRRRMIVRSMSSRNGQVTIVGRVVPPLGRPVSAITLTQRVSCSHEKVVKRFHPDAHGNFRVTVPAPKTGTTAVYRLTTFVRPSANSHRLSPTYTLPRAVELHQR